MRLQEEYFKRHNIDSSPIYHVKEANLILKIRERPQVVLNIKWNYGPNLTGYYTFNFLQPNYNGYFYSNYFSQLDTHYYDYEKYYDFILRWANNLEFNPVSSTDAKLAVWEMFLYCFDEWVANNKIDVYKTINQDLDKEARLNAIDEILWGIDPLIEKIYEAKFRRFEYNYANWLAELILFFKKRKTC